MQYKNSNSPQTKYTKLLCYFLSSFIPRSNHHDLKTRLSYCSGQRLTYHNIVFHIETYLSQYNIGGGDLLTSTRCYKEKSYLS